MEVERALPFLVCERVKIGGFEEQSREDVLVNIRGRQDQSFGAVAVEPKFEGGIAVSPEVHCPKKLVDRRNEGGC